MGKQKSASGEEFLELTRLLFTYSQGMAPQVCPLLYPAHGRVGYEFQHLNI